MLAYDQLLGEGYAQARVGSGTIVAPTLPERWTASLAPVASGRSGGAAGGEARLAQAGTRAVDIARVTRLHWDLRGGALPYDFRFGRPAFADFPHTVWCRLIGRRARSAGRSELDYGPPAGRLELRSKLPFGVFLALGGLVALFAGGPLARWYGSLLGAT